VTQVVAVDIGGTHARFAIADVADGRVQSLGNPVTLKTAEHASFQTAWEAYGSQLGHPLPAAAAIAFAGPVGSDVLQLTNSHWTIRPSLIPERLHVDRFMLVNDFAAVGHAVAHANPLHFQHICGPNTVFPESGVTSIVGPGTGLGVAHVVRAGGHYHVCATEGGHLDFAPLDAFEDGLVDHLRKRYRRVSVERVVSGPGLSGIYEAFGRIEGRIVDTDDNKMLWTAALDGSDSLAVAALDRFCMSLGSVTGDLALAQGANAVVIAGGLGARIAGHLPQSGFAQRFAAKGRFEAMMAAIPVKLITIDQPGLYGAAAAFATEHTL
jgi:glucokinase